MSLPVMLMSDEMIEDMQELADGVFDGLSTTFYVTWEPVQQKLKRGITARGTTQDSIPMLIRSADEARRNDMLLGITMVGDYIGISSRAYTFQNGDRITDARGKKYSVENVSMKPGQTYWILDLKEVKTDPAS